MRWRLPIILPGLLAGYIFLFLAQGQYASVTDQGISPALPSRMLHVLGHSYMNQIIAESLFIKTAVYYGGLNREMDAGNLEVMQQHFITMSQLHPRMLDIYYRAESVLAHRGNTYAKTANQILETGRATMPDQLALPFFEGFNYFYYLGNPAKAAEILRIASMIPGSPQWIGHLASMLAARGGNIRTGLIWLQGMLASSTDEEEKARYRGEIESFEQALQVQMALEQHIRRVGTPPNALSDLAPNDIRQLPTFKNGFMLEYKKPNLFLTRIHLPASQP